jgi:hypothetical protein
MGSSKPLRFQERIDQIQKQADGTKAGNQVIHKSLSSQSFSHALVNAQHSAKNNKLVPM